MLLLFCLNGCRLGRVSVRSSSPVNLPNVDPRSDTSLYADAPSRFCIEWVDLGASARLTSILGPFALQNLGPMEDEERKLNISTATAMQGSV